ncbi:hypothetical protein Axi01nite_56540 [Actinoplanes xinjiangensis]|nr:hypothetical protein Axi01nite_56540 [Actinoplanes xinjiangensis]
MCDTVWRVNPDAPTGASVSAGRRGVQITFPPGSVPTADIIPAFPVRRCGYSQCGNELTYDGKGRPPEYCPDRRWPGNKTCRQLAATEREGIRAAGLDAVLDEYTATTDRLLSAARPLAEHLNAVLTTVGEVRSGALTRIGEAERQVAEALERAAEADRVAQAARAEEARAAGAAAAAQAQAEQVEARMLEVRADAENQVAAATHRLAAVERQHGQAVAAQRTAESNQRAAELRSVKAIAEATLLRKQAEQAESEIAKLRNQVQAADNDRRMLTQRIKDLTQRNTDMTDQQRTSAEREKKLDTVVAALREENTALNTRLNDARVTVAAADARAEAAEARYTELLTVLSDPARRGAAPKGPTA